MQVSKTSTAMDAPAKQHCVAARFLNARSLLLCDGQA
jgi:hypothetical protein